MVYGRIVTFDQMRRLVSETSGLPTETEHGPVYFVRDLYGILRLVAHEALEADAPRYDELVRIAGALGTQLGAHAAQDRGLVFAGQETLGLLSTESQELAPGCRWVDRLVTGRDWATVKPRDPQSARRITLYSVKGGVGRTTTAAVLAAHLARRGERVLVVDLDVESPGLSSAVLEPDKQPEYGVTDWFVEDLVDQGDALVPEVVGLPTWADEMEGDVLIVPAYGRDPGEYLAKLGRVYMGDDWPGRLRRMLLALETHWQPTFTLIESRSGLHDVAAAAVTDVGADVLLFAMDSANHWVNYSLLFRHWQSTGLAPLLRERLLIVSGLTPLNDQAGYLASFRERSWDLFRETLYDEAEDGEIGSAFSFDLDDGDAPHMPIPIYWNPGLASGGSMLNLDETSLGGAYGPFLSQFDALTLAWRE